MTILLQCSQIGFYDRDGGETNFETLDSFDEEPEDPVGVIRDYLAEEHGEDYETTIFESVQVYKDKDHCCGVFVEATDMEGDVLRFWFQRVKKSRESRQ